MAERWAVATGLWSSTATWNGGTLPAVDDDIYANGFTVTVDSNRTALTVRTTAGTTAVAGGTFNINSGVTLTLTGSGANAIAGTSTCCIFSGSSPATATLVGNPAGSQTSANRWGINNQGSGTLNVIGNPVGGSQATAHGAINSTSGVLNITGNPVGGSSSTANGCRNISTGTMNIIGTPQGGTSASGAHWVAGSGAVTGSAIGGSGSTSTGVTNAGTGTVTISGNATGGSHTTAYGASNTGTGTLTVAWAAISTTAPGVFGATTATLTSIGSARTGTDEIFPYAGKVVFANLSTASLSVRNPAGTLGELSTGGPKNVFSPPSVFGAS